MLATVEELYTVPMIAKGFSLMARRITATEVGGSDWVSMTKDSSGRPSTPPFLLISSTARITPSRHIVPEGAPPPVTSATMASLTAFWADAGSVTAAAAARTATSTSRKRRDCMQSSWGRRRPPSVGSGMLTSP